VSNLELQALNDHHADKDDPNRNHGQTSRHEKTAQRSSSLSVGADGVGVSKALTSIAPNKAMKEPKMRQNAAAGIYGQI
jgi:hypothetical protein